MATAPDDDPTLVLTEDERAERARIITALSASAGNTAKAASSLGWSRRTLIEKFERYRIPSPPKPAPTDEARAELARILAELAAEEATGPAPSPDSPKRTPPK
jgi:DNA-binding NtrC family response regulator